MRTKVKQKYSPEELKEAYVFPGSANLLDANRCTFIFRTEDDILKAVRWFRSLQGGDGKDPKAAERYPSLRIVRIKNGFLKTARDKATGQIPCYRDVKVNVAFKSDEKQLEMITEIQLQLEAMQKMKD